MKFSTYYDVVLAKMVINFEIRLDRHWANEDFKFNYEANKPSPTRKAELTSAAPPGLHMSEEDL